MVPTSHATPPLPYQNMLYCIVLYVLSVPGAPRNLNVTASSATTLRVTWGPPDPPNGILLNYTLTYAGPTGDEVTLTTPNMEEVLMSLEEFTMYIITVRASTSVGMGPPATFSIMTPGAGKSFR